jgi:hypothetical protein
VSKVILRLYHFTCDAYFESVPDEFIDVKSADWKWKDGQRDIPIIIPSFFLDLYNTGMAMSQKDLPQLSLEAIQAIPIKVMVRGRDRKRIYGSCSGTV